MHACYKVAFNNASASLARDVLGLSCRRRTRAWMFVARALLKVRSWGLLRDRTLLAISTALVDSEPPGSSDCRCEQCRRGALKV